MDVELRSSHGTAAGGPGHPSRNQASSNREQRVRGATPRNVWYAVPLCGKPQRAHHRYLRRNPCRIKRLARVPPPAAAPPCIDGSTPHETQRGAPAGRKSEPDPPGVRLLGAVLVPSSPAPFSSILPPVLTPSHFSSSARLHPGRHRPRSASALL